MQSAQESLAELRAAIRYCENAISAAESTIESMDFRQQLAKQQAMNKKESTGREVALTETVKDLEMTNETLVIDNHNLERKVESLTKQVEELTQANMNIVCDNDDLNDELFKLRKEKEASSGPCGCQAYRDLEEKVATMPVIPRDVAIAIFREGVQSGVRDAVAELEGNTIKIRENDYVGDFEVSFSRDIDLDDELDLDWMRDKVGQYNEEFVADALKGLCEKENFECRIHGIDDNK
jgi:regulator of replication initiation timing